jgi:predicted nucleic-acid-binding Zn-ribbon protein
MENEQKKAYVCVKCGNDSYNSGKISTTGSSWSKFFNLQNNKFITVICLKCGYTELYKTSTSGLENVGDFLFGK